MDGLFRSHNPLVVGSIPTRPTLVTRGNKEEEAL